MSADLAVSFLKAVTSQVDSGGAPQAFDTTALPPLEDLAATADGRFACSFVVSPAVQNRYGTLHGGCIATIVDTVGTAALVTVSPRSGVSVSINVSYLNPAPAGSRVKVVAQVVKAGRTMATIDVRLTDSASGQVIAQGTHIKFCGGSEKPAQSWTQQQQQQEGAGAPPPPRLPGPRSKL